MMAFKWEQSFSSRFTLCDLVFVYGILISICFQLSRACAPMTHTEIGERAKEFLSINSEGVNYTELILKHPDAYQAGCPFPDAFYPGICFDGNYHDISEETHWTPFLNATVNYIRKTYTRPWNERAEKLVVFLLAVIQHQVADVNWHSLGIAQGFLETMGKVNYHGSYGAAHNDGDFGGDVLNLYGLDMDYIPLVGTWYVPVDDLLGIYTDLTGRNDSMLPEVVVECTNWLFLGRLGENLGVIEYLYPRYAEDSPFLTDRLQDYFLGGIDDMAVWSANVYDLAVTMLDHGTEVCDLPRNPIYIQCNVIDDNDARGRHRRALTSGDKYNTKDLHVKDKPTKNKKHFDEKLEVVREKYEWLYAAVSLVDKDDYVISDVDGGVIFSSTEHYKNRMKKKIAERKSTVSDEAQNTHVNFTLPEVFYTTRINYSRLGETLLSADVNSDGDLDLVIGAPGYGTAGNYQRGSVYVIYGTDSGLPARNLTVEDEADIMLEGPQLNGRFGISLAVADLNIDGYEDLVVGAPSVGSDILEYYGEVYVYFGSLTGFKSSPDVTITCSEHYCNLGWTLSTGDVNGDGNDDLLLGAPFAPSGGEQRGFAGVLYAKSSLTAGNLNEDDLDLRWNGDQDYGWFGYSITYAGDKSIGNNRVVVGSPTYRICDVFPCQDYSQDDLQSVGRVTSFTQTAVDVDVFGNVTFGQLGYSVSGTAGNGPQLLSVAATTQEYDYVDDVTRSDIDVNATVPFLQLGLVKIYDTTDFTSEPYFSVVGDREFGRAGAVVKFLELNGDSQTDVIISSPLRSETIENGREEGRVYIFTTDEGMRGETYTVNQADIVLGLGDDQARFGYSVAPIQAQTGQVQVAISAPHSNRNGRLAGVVTVFTL